MASPTTSNGRVLAVVDIGRSGLQTLTRLHTIQRISMHLLWCSMRPQQARCQVLTVRWRTRWHMWGCPNPTRNVLIGASNFLSCIHGTVLPTWIQAYMWFYRRTRFSQMFCRHFHMWFYRSIRFFPDVLQTFQGRPNNPETKCGRRNVGCIGTYVKPRMYWMIVSLTMCFKTKNYPFNVSFHLRDERKVQLQFFCVRWRYLSVVRTSI